MKTRNIALTLGLIASTAAFAEGSAGSAGSAAPSGTTSGTGSSGPSSSQTAPSDGSMLGAPAGGTANNGGAITNGSSSTGSSFGNSSTDVTGSASTTMNSGALNSRQSVMDAQRALVNQGFSVSVDGRSGPQTTSAIRQFQARNGIPETGVIDSRTQEALSNNTGSAAQPSASDTSAQ